jgi:hypothetical protein
MSLGGRGASPSVIVYGPDRTEYGSPADAAAAGVSNATMSQPIGVPDNPYVPMQVPAPQYYTPPAYQPYTPAPLPNIPTQSYGGRNRYAEIMSNYQQAQPYSFTSMLPSYSGGFTGYPSDYTGGFTPYQPPVNTQPINDIENIATVLPITGGGGGGGGGFRGAPSDGAPGEGFNPTSESAYNVSQFGRNLGYVSPLTGALTGMYGNYLASQVDPNYSNEGRNYPAPTGGFLSTPDTQAVQNAINNTDFSGMDRGSISSPPSTPDTQAVRDAINNTDFSGMDRGGGGGGGDRSNSNPGDPGRGGGGAHLAKGGYVSMQHLGGPDPKGPDDGYAALKDGEFVINDKAVKRYGIDLMNAINSGKISKGKLRGLLEM